MGAGHGPADGLYVHGHGVLHRMPAECKLVAVLAFVFTVVSTPREAFWAFAAFAVLLAVVAVVAGLSLGLVSRRLVIEVPFLAFAFLLPIVGRGERVDVLGIGLSHAGLWAAWNILAKGTLGVAATVIMASTTPIRDILHGLQRLRLPAVIVGICSFMIRYSDVVTGEMRRMRVARESRGHDPRWIWQARAVASSAGALFIRSYERGERVYLAMASRGYSGAMPVLDERRAARRDWVTAAMLPLAALVVASTAWVLR